MFAIRNIMQARVIVWEGEEDPPKTYTQVELDTMLAEERKKSKSTHDKTISELEALKAKSNLTSKEREDLESRIENMRKEYMTKEELQKQEADKLVKQHETEKTDLLKERDNWKNLFTESTISRDLTDSAAAHKAFNPSQIVAVLRPNTKIVDEIDDSGNPTGRLITKTKISTVDKNKKPVTLELPPTEAVKLLKDMPEYQNLFHGEGTGGFGSHNRNNRHEEDLSELAKDPAAYRKARAEGKVKFR